MVVQEFDFENERKAFARGEKELRRSQLGKALKPDQLEIVLRIALTQCRIAANHDWTGDLVRDDPEIRKKWEAANLAARKLAVHLEQLDDLTGWLRLRRAEKSSGIQLGIKKPDPKQPWHNALAAYLRGLATSAPRQPQKHGYRQGPIIIDRPSHKAVDKAAILTLWLAFLFGRLRKQVDVEDYRLAFGEPIVEGAAWDAAAQFATDTWGKTVDPSNAKKFLSSHKGHIRCALWKR